MRIGFLTAEFSYRKKFRGGLGNYLYRITTLLAAAGHEPHVFFYCDYPTAVDFVDGVYVHTINNQPSRLFHALTRVSRNKFRKTLTSLERGVRFRNHVARITQMETFDILQSTNTEFPGLFVKTDIPFIIRCSSYRPYIYQYDNRKVTLDWQIYAYLERLQYRLANGVFAPTNLLASILSRELGIKGVKVIRTPFFVEETTFDTRLLEQKLSGKRYILFFGKLTHLKGAEILADAIPEVLKKTPDLHVAIVGEDSKFNHTMLMSDYIRRKCAGYEQNLVFFPLIPHAQLYPIIQNAEFVVLPTLFDNSPNTMLEAMGLGKSVIGTIGTSMDEIIEDNVSGFLVPAGDPKALGDKICEVWCRKDLAKIGQAAKVAMSNHSPDKVLPQLLGYYQQFLH